MITIKFSHSYDKMPHILKICSNNRTHLLEVLRAYREDLSQAFVNYDTSYHEGEKVNHYPLPDGPLLVLLLITWNPSFPKENLMWTTIRPYTEQKEAYYRSHRGEEVQIGEVEKT